jgi:hypothetical protein
MKTLYELLRAELRTDESNEPDLVAGLVGAVQEWLGQDGARHVVREGLVLGRGALETLRIEAGRGLGE